MYICTNRHFSQLPGILYCSQNIQNRPTLFLSSHCLDGDFFLSFLVIWTLQPKQSLNDTIEGKLCTCYSLKTSYDFILIKQWGDKPQWNCSSVQLVFELLKMTALCKNGCNSWRVQSFILTLKDFKNISLVLCDIKMINHKCIHLILQVHHHTFDWLTHSAVVLLLSIWSLTLLCFTYSNG